MEKKLTVEEYAEIRKIRFIAIIDGVTEYGCEPMVKGLDSFTLGICKLDFDGEKLHVYLRRPGLLIGNKGETLKHIIDIFGSDIKVYDVILTK